MTFESVQQQCNNISLVNKVNWNHSIMRRIMGFLYSFSFLYGKEMFTCLDYSGYVDEYS